MADPEQSIESVFDSIRTFELRPGDVIAIRCQGHLSHDMAARLTHEVERRFPENKCIVMDGCMDLAVVRPAEAQG